ncbi:hypothetical protein OEZ85_007259 [Tetradesmus obliquus]|uniref:1-phosphatidylinositol-4-phosphate 5-kinase n=1 Tax=Tetradesmus obliquus TaxID=3088 RepID=A0ABY8TX58_TETOB|nr:hypothetical protein OEZ85_007259 [Tetradesmus obliquus]
MHGFGTYVWKNGQRYDGEWKDGRREGIGIKTYVDGSMYDGFWSGGEAAAAGPGAAAAAAPRKLFVREYDMGQLLREYPLTAEEIKMIFGFLWPKNKVRRRVQRVLRRGPRMQKKLGEVVYKGHYSYSLMLELQLGIRYSVGRALRPRGASAQSGSSAVSLLRSSFALHGLRPWWSMSAGVSGVSCVSGGHTKEDDQDEQQRQQQQQRGASEAAVMVADEDVGELCGQDFREKAAVYFPSSGSSTTPAHPSMDFMWRDYCPRVFRRLRKAAGIDEADYMLSLAGAQALRQLNSPGKSGSMFLLSEDERFLVKTMRKSEMSVLLGMLEAYSEHMERHPNSLITRFFGLHKVTPAHGRSVRFVVMANIFVTDLQIHRRYDIKGSTDGRTVGPEGRNKAADGDPNIIFKDLDVDMRIVLEQAQHEALLQQLAADSDLLKRVGVMDYSLLLGVHYPARNYTRMSLEPVHSQSLDGLAPQASPLPGGAGASTVPGSGLTSAQGSFLLAEPYSSSAAGAAAVAGGAGVGGAAGASTRHLTVSDDDVQQPPQLLRLAAQQQAQTYAQQQMQQQEASNATGGGAEVPGGLAGGGGRSGRSSYEQVPYAPVQFPIGRTSTSEDVQMPPVAAAAFTLPPGIGAGSTGGSAFAGGFPAGGFGSAAGTAGGAGSAAGSHHGGDRSSMLAGGASAGAAGARNWELWSGAAEQEELLGKVVERMKEMGFSEQRMKDVAELARLKILGGKLKKSAARKEPPSAVLQAMQQQRQEAEGALVDGPLAHGALLPVAPSSPDAAAAAAAAALGTPAAAIPPAPLVVRPTLPSHLSSLRGAFTGLGVPFEEDEEAVDTPMALGLPDPKAPAAAAGNAAAGLLGSGRLGINLPAKAVPTVQPLGGSSGGKGGAAAAAAAGAAAALDHRLGPEEVVLCFGIIDILQDYSTRKVLERTVKGVTHDKAAISVAPPKQYARRFLDFATRQVFMSEQEYRSSLAHSGYGSSSQADTLAGVQQQQQLGVAAMQSPWATAVANGRQQQLPAGHAAAAAVGEHGDGVLVPAVVVELQGVADKSPASKQGSLERQMELTAGANGVKGVNGHVVVVNGVGQSS